MKRKGTWAPAIAVVVAAIAAACGSSGTQSGFTPGGGGGANDGGPNGGDGSIPIIVGGDAASDQHSPPPRPIGCDPSCEAAGGQCVNNVCVITENPGNVDPGTQGQLEGGGNADPAFKFLYPYDKTVFPRGLLPPTMQMQGTDADATYVHVTFSGMDYKGFYGKSSPARVAFSQPVWKAITLAALAQDDVKVEVTKIFAGAVTGPQSETWNMAQGSLRGTIFYETYDSQLAGGLGSVGIMKIQPGATAPTVVKTGCGNVCHTASADGSTLVSATSLFASASWDLKNNATVIHDQADDTFTYGGIYPDGSVLMSATNYRTWLNTPSKLYDVKSGTAIAAPGWDGTITNAAMPAFAPDGSKIVFNREDTGQGHTLSVMDFARGSNAFSNLVDLAHDGSLYLGWPAFTPDTKWVVYHAGSNAVFETDNNETGDLFAIDLATKTKTRLDALDGYGAGGSVYLPANDPNLSFAPTVLPEAVGGYFWVVFTSHRSYGNTLASKDNNDEYGKLWVAAFDLDPQPGKDPSHPAFFLDGQETHADNLRGFWVLDACKADGSDCRSGDECCDGFCRPMGPTLQCVPPPGGCSHEFEKCMTSADCCDAGYQCINGHCAQPPPR